MIFRGYYSGVKPFSPLDYTPLAWYDAIDEGTITKDILNYISQWNDKSGNANHVIALAGTNQPLYDTINKSSVFDGINDFLLKDEIPVVQKTTLFAVYKIDNSANGYQAIVSSAFLGSTYNHELIHYKDASFDVLYAYSGGANSISYNKTIPFGYIVSTVVFDYPNINIYENNVLKGTTNLGGNEYMRSIRIGSGYFGGGVFSMFLNGAIKEIIIYGSVLTTEQITTVNNYLNTKYNVY